MSGKKGWFNLFSQKVATWTGHSLAFGIACITVLAWALTGPMFHFSDTWQLVINTGTTIVTFLMVFLIQNTQNRDGRALQLKLDELIRATEGAHTSLLDLEELSEQELAAFSAKYYKIAEIARTRLRSGQSDMDIPDIILDESPLSVKKS